MKPKKSLGQNFLKDEKVLGDIIKAADLSDFDNVIEIGPGEGALTQELLRHARKIICIEKDDSLALRLDSRLRGNAKVEIINEDILEINLPELIEKNNFQKYKVVANIPYYITSPIIRLFLETAYPPSEMILMVQKEVAGRICARPGQMSILAVSVGYYAKAEILFEVGRESFFPAPDVDSAVIRIFDIKNSDKDREKTKNFFRVVRAGFSAKRKTLANNLANSLQLEKKEVEDILKSAGIKPSQRAQELSVSDWEKLAELIILISEKSAKAEL